MRHNSALDINCEIIALIACSLSRHEDQIPGSIEGCSNGVVNKY